MPRAAYFRALEVDGVARQGKANLALLMADNSLRTLSLLMELSMVHTAAAMTPLTTSTMASLTCGMGITPMASAQRAGNER